MKSQLSQPQQETKRINTLARAYQKGDEDSFSELWNSFLNPYLHTCRHQAKLRYPEMPEELLEEVSTATVLRAINTWKISGGCSFKTWLCRLWKQRVFTARLALHAKCRWPLALSLEDYESETGQESAGTGLPPDLQAQLNETYDLKRN